MEDLKRRSASRFPPVDAEALGYEFANSPRGSSRASWIDWTHRSAGLTRMLMLIRG
jgi:hypothetical protein